MEEYETIYYNVIIIVKSQPIRIVSGQVVTG